MFALIEELAWFDVTAQNSTITQFQKEIRQQK